MRYQVSAKKQASARPFNHHVYQRQTTFMMPVSSNTGSQTYIHEIYQALIQDELRNRLILDDIKQTLSEGRSPLVLTERKEHVLLLAESVKEFAKNVFVMQGGMGVRQRKKLLTDMQEI